MASFQEALRIIASNRVKKGDPVHVAARHEVMNAFSDAIIGLACGENIGRGKGIRKRSTRSSVTFAADLVRGRGGSSAIHPFQVTSETAEPGQDPKIKVRPGTVMGLIPKIDGVLLDATVPPSLSFNADGMVLIRVNISGISGTFRPVISSVEVKKQTGLIIQDDDTDPLDELTMIWDDEDTKITGYFYIRVATVKAGVPVGETDAAITDIIQYLTNNVYSFIITVDEVIMLSK